MVPAQVALRTVLLEVPAMALLVAQRKAAPAVSSDLGQPGVVLPQMTTAPAVSSDLG